MNRPKLKLFGGIVLLAVLCLLYGGFLLLTNSFVNGVYDLKSQAAKVKAVNSSVGSLMDLNSFVEGRELEKFTNRIAFAAVAAKGMIENDWDGKSLNYNNGVIVTVSGDKIDYPKDYPEEQKIDVLSLTDTFGLVPVRAGQGTGGGKPHEAFLVGYYKIGDNVYYMECEKASVLDERARASFDAGSRMEAIEKALGVQVLIISGEEDLNGEHELLYIPDNLSKGVHTAEECGITKEMLSGVSESTKDVTAYSLLESSDIVDIKGTSYQICLQAAKGSEFSDTKVYLAYLIPQDEFVTMTVEQTVVLLVAYLIIGITLLVWYYSLIRLVRFYRLNEEQAQQLGFKKTVRKAVSQILIGCVVVFIIAALFLSLFRLFGVCSSVKKSLKVLEKRIEENKIQEKATIKELKNTYVSYAERIAEILEERPDLLTQESLQDFSELIGADYIMIYDQNGKEVLSNSKYVDMELGRTQESSTYEFRRLLKGIPSVVHDVKTDEETGLKNALIGVCMKNPMDPEKYWAFLVAVPESKLVPEGLETINDVMKSLVTEGTFAFSVDPENQSIVNASDKSLVGRNAVSMELPESAITDSYRDFFNFDDVSCYGESKGIDKLFYYYAAEQPHIYKNVLPYAGIAAGACFLFQLVFVFYLLFGYRKGFEHWSKEGEELEERMDDGDSLNEDAEQQEDPRKRWKLSLSRFGMRTPMHNATVTLEILMVGTVIGLGVWYYFNGGSSSGSLLSFVMYGQWTKGLNLFSFISILILFAQVLIVVSVLKVLIRIVSTSMGPKGETFCRLALNLLTYAGMIFFVYMALYNVGINLGALVASLSLPAFALSLGAKDLITDIVAGISIVFDGEFKVGDIVDISGYRGTVLEIGVRTTKLQGSGNNIKVLANRDVKNVINMSKKTSFYNLDVKISMKDNKLKDVEDMLAEQLPKLHDQIPGIINGPTYRGISSIGGGAVVLTISAECTEANFGKVKKEMNHAIQDLFDEQGIAIL